MFGAQVYYVNRKQKAHSSCPSKALLCLAKYRFVGEGTPHYWRHSDEWSPNWGFFFLFSTGLSSYSSYSLIDNYSRVMTTTPINPMTKNISWITCIECVGNWELVVEYNLTLLNKFSWNNLLLLLLLFCCFFFPINSEIEHMEGPIWMNMLSHCAE